MNFPNLSKILKINPTRHDTGMVREPHIRLEPYILMYDFNEAIWANC